MHLKTGLYAVQITIEVDGGNVNYQPIPSPYFLYPIDGNIFAGPQMMPLPQR